MADVVLARWKLRADSDALQKYQQMKAQGAGEDNPEYAKLHGILTAVHQQQYIQKQRQLQAQLQRQQQERQQGETATHVQADHGE